MVHVFGMIFVMTFDRPVAKRQVTLWIGYFYFKKPRMIVQYVYIYICNFFCRNVSHGS